jgi:hypothetical protein
VTNTLTPVNFRRAHILATLFMLACSGVQHILCVVFVLFVFFLCILC